MMTMTTTKKKKIFFSSTLFRFYVKIGVRPNFRSNPFEWISILVKIWWTVDDIYLMNSNLAIYYIESFNKLHECNICIFFLIFGQREKIEILRMQEIFFIVC